MGEVGGSHKQGDPVRTRIALHLDVMGASTRAKIPLERERVERERRGERETREREREEGESERDER